jgi:hypothetical protein
MRVSLAMLLVSCQFEGSPEQRKVPTTTAESLDEKEAEESSGSLAGALVAVHCSDT